MSIDDFKSLIESQREMPEESFDGKFTGMGNQWFLAYAKYAYLDENYKRWDHKDIKSQSDRKSDFKHSIYMHEIWLKDLQKKYHALKAQNKPIPVKDSPLKMTGDELLDIVDEILSKTREERLSHCLKIIN